MNEKPSGRDAHLAEKKLAVNSTARVRKSRKRLFVLGKCVEICAENKILYFDELKKQMLVNRFV